MRFVAITLLALLLLVMRTVQASETSQVSEDGPNATKQQTAAGDEKPDKARYLLAYQFKPTQRVFYDVQQKTEIITQRDNIVEKVTNSSKARKHYRVVAVVKGTHGILEPVVDNVEDHLQCGGDDA